MISIILLNILCVSICITGSEHMKDDPIAKIRSITEEHGSCGGPEGITYLRLDNSDNCIILSTCLKDIQKINPTFYINTCEVFVDTCNIEHTTEILKHPGIRSVRFCTEPQQYQGQVLPPELYEAALSHTAITGLEIRNLQFDMQKLCTVIAQHKNISKVNFARIPINSNDALKPIIDLVQKSTIEYLGIVWCCLGGYMMDSIEQLIHWKNEKLKSISLQHNLFSPETQNRIENLAKYYSVEVKL